MGDLRALFSSNDRSVTVAEAFTNRQEQWQAVVVAVGEHLRLLGEGRVDVEDLEAPRGNVLVFHGVGGVGKTTLSRQVEVALGGRRPEQWPAAPWPQQAVLPVRLDLSQAAGAGFEHLVLELRLALTALGRPLPAFDIALRRYWEHNHPGEPLEEYLRRGGPAARFSDALPAQMHSALADVAQALLLPGTVGSAVGEVTGSLVRALRERRQTVRALAGCSRLADLLEAEPSLDALSFFPHLLAWELARLPARAQRTPVVLMDAFDEAAADTTRRDMERLLQRLVWLMPNCFFLITGRSRLAWADPALHGQLDWSGPSAWPGLAAHSLPHLPDRGPGHRYGRQLLIGDFSRQDSEDYLARRLTAGGRPLMPGPVRRTIVERSHGLPLHLELSVLRFLHLRRTSGQMPQPGDFDADFPALISRTLADLTAEERHVLRAVSLLQAFDVPLAAAAAGQPQQAAAARLVERPFVRQEPGGLWPYSLHPLVRSTLRTAEDTTDDRWIEADWRQAAQRALDALGQPDSGTGRRAVVGRLRQGLALAAEFGLPTGWLTEAAWQYVSDSVWEPLTAVTGDDGGLRTPADALVEILSTLARRQHEHRERTVERLTAVLDCGLLPAGLEEMALYYRAKADRDLGRTAASQTGMRQVAEREGRLAPAARRGLAHLARLAGDFPTAVQAARTLGWPGRGHRVEGDVLWPQGDMERAADAYRAARQDAERHGVVGETATAQAHRALVLAFADSGRAAGEIELADQLLAGLDLRATRLTVRIAALVRDAGTPTGDLVERAGLIRTEAESAGLTGIRLLAELALCFHHAVRADHHQLAAGLGRLRARAEDGTFAYYADIAHFMAGLPLPAPSSARWLDGPEITRARWRRLVETRQQQGEQ